MNKETDILLPDGTRMKRFCDRALVMERGYRERYEEMLADDAREGVVLAYIILKMDENNELICDLNTLAEELKCSRASVARAVRLFKEKYKDLVTVGKFHGVSKFMIDREKCFKSVRSGK